MKKYILIFLLMLLLGSLDLNTAYGEDNLQSLINDLDEGSVLHLENKTYEGISSFQNQLKLLGAKKQSLKVMVQETSSRLKLQVLN